MKESLLTIDGSQGEGGGQIVRTSLALSAITGRPIRITRLRANRSRPGLMRQHLAAVKAAARICRAEVTGDVLQSSEITFIPGAIAGGEYRFGVDTAGSTTLILQTILPALMCADQPSHVVLTGGTHNPFAPPFDFLQRAYVPLVNRLGPKIELELVRPGFFPAGGGEFHVRVSPSQQLSAFQLLERGELRSRKVAAYVSNLPLHIAERECRAIEDASGWEAAHFTANEITGASGPGNVVLIELHYEHVTEVFVGFGMKGVRAEQVAMRVWREAEEYLQSDVPVGTHLADQLLLPLALAAAQGSAGSFRTLALTQHAWTHRDILQMFLDVDIQVDERGSDDVYVRLEQKG